MDVSKLSKATRIAKASEKAADLAKVAEKAADLAKVADKASDVAKVAEKASDIALVAEKTAEAAKLSEKAADLVTVAEKAKAAKVAELASVSDKANDVSKIAKESQQAQKVIETAIHRGTKTDPTPLFEALAANSTDALEGLLKSGFDVNGSDFLGQTALHKVAFEGNNDIVQRLLSAGADPLIADARNRTPLFWAAVKGKEDVVKTLLDAGSNPNVVDTLGNSALDVAMKRGKTGVAQALETAGAKPLADGVSTLGKKLDFSNPQFQLFNDEIYMLKSNPSNISVEGRLKTFYEGIFGGDDELLKADNKLVDDWTSTYSNHPNQAAMRKSWEKVLQGEAPTSNVDKAVADTVVSRKERWERLSQQTGIPVPESFTVYRGVKGKEFVDSVVKAWSDDTANAVQLRHHTLASWSMDKSVANSFAKSGSSATSVVLETDVPFDMTFTDKWADDGNFIKTFGGENEVIVGTMMPDSMAIPKDKVTVNFDGKTYTYAEKDALISAWNAQGNPIKGIFNTIKSWFE